MGLRERAQPAAQNLFHLPGRPAMQLRASGSVCTRLTNRKPVAALKHRKYITYMWGGIKEEMREL